MKKMYLAPIGILALAAALVLLWVVPASAAPPIPASFYGTVTEGGSGWPAPAGVTIEARVGGVVYGRTTTFASGNLTVYALDVVGDDPDTVAKEGAMAGEQVVLLVNGVADPIATQWQSGANTQRNLAWTAPATPPPSGAFAPEATPTPTPTPIPIFIIPIETPMAAPEGGAVAVVHPNASTAMSSPDGDMTLRIPRLATDTSFQLEYKPVDTAAVPPLPEGSVALYSFELNPYDAEGNRQSSVRFINPLTIVVKYTDADVAAAGGDPTRLKVMRYDSATKAWATLASQVNMGSKTVTATLVRLSLFALGAQPAPGVQQQPTPTPTPTPTPIPTPTPAPTATPTPTPAPTATPTPTPAPTATPTVRPPAAGDVSPGGSMLVMGLIGGIVVLLIGMYFMVRRPEETR